MKAKILAAAALITLGALGSASAADLPMPAPDYKAPPPPPVYNWTGCYIGGGGGYGWWNQDSQVVVTATGLPFLPRSPTAVKAGSVKARAAATTSSICRLARGISPSLSAPLVTGGGSIQGTQSTVTGVGSEHERVTWAVGGRAGYLVTRDS